MEMSVEVRDRPHRWCCIATSCPSLRGMEADLTFHRFPKDVERCTLWLKRAGRLDLVGRPSREIYKTCFLCSRHFETSQFLVGSENRKVLVPDAVPTLFDSSQDLETECLSSLQPTAAGEAQVLVLEPYLGGSHKQLVDLLVQHFPGTLHVLGLPARKWHWRARVSALHFAQTVPMNHTYRSLFASSVLNLCELCSLRPDLGALTRKVLYFHENQLEYPVLNPKERDFQFGYNQILSCLVANDVLFNSAYNMESFLTSVHTFLNQMPDVRIRNVEAQIRRKSRVLYFPVSLPAVVLTARPGTELRKPLHIVWPHRWEHDKNPELFFWSLFQLQEAGLDFRVSVLGEFFQQVPEIFLQAEVQLKEQIETWGFQASREDYLQTLRDADCVVSTSNHEFFGVAVLEAVSCGCYPLCPNRLVYPEIFPAEYLYNTPCQLLKTLKRFCKYPQMVRQHKIKVDVTRYSWETLAHDYGHALGITPSK